MQYRRRDSLQRLYELKKSFIDQLAKEMDTNGRYPEDAILRGKGYVLIEEDAFRDYLKNRDKLKAAIVVAPYKRAETPEDIYLLGGAYERRNL